MENHQQPVRLSRRLVSYLICFLIAGQPVFPAFAAATPANGSTQMDRAANGVPIVNIATPNGAGISHNQFKDYSVGKEGIILNNATGQLNQTQLGGLIQGNANLKAGAEARGIINEVTGGSRSQLQGYTEVAGKAANVMVANPYGITCNGCGFINTPNATLTTGRPVFDASGNVQSLDVTKGSILVEGKGLDASQADALTIISRATEINAQIHARDLKVIAGANRVTADGKATAIAGEGPAPTVSIDTGALGGMYANRIHLVSSEKGVGVNLGNLDARQGDIILDASGRLTVKNSLASGSLTAKGDGVVLNGEHKAAGSLNVSGREIALSSGKFASDGDITLSSSGKLALNDATLTVGKDLKLNAGEFTQNQASRVDAARNISATVAARADSQGQMVAGKDFVFQANELVNGGRLSATGELKLNAAGVDSSGTLSGKAGLKITGSSLTTRTGSSTGSQGNITLNVTRADLDGSIIATGDLSARTEGLTARAGSQLQSDGALVLQAKDATLNGTLAAKGALSVSADKLIHGGKASAPAITLQADSLTNNGTVVTPSLTLKAERLTNGGLLKGDQSLILNASRLDNLAGASLYSAQNLSFNVPVIDNAGLITSERDLLLDGGQLTNIGEINGKNLTLNSGSVLNKRDGVLLAEDDLKLTGSTFENAGLLKANNVDLRGDSFINAGTIEGGRSLSLLSSDARNQGKLLTGGNLTVNADAFTNDGKLQATALLLSLTRQFTNQRNGVLDAESRLTITAVELTNAGLIDAAETTVNASKVTNSGALQGRELLTLTAGALDNQSAGNLLSNGVLTLALESLTNAGIVKSINGISATVEGAGSSSGEIWSQKGITLTADSLSNSGKIQGRSLALNANTLTNNGLWQGSDWLTASGDAITVGRSGRVLTDGALTLTGGTLVNDGLLQGGQDRFTARSWRNGGSAIGKNSFSVSVSDTLVNDGDLLSNGPAAIRAQTLSNGGSLLSDGEMTLDGAALTNSGSIQGKNLTVHQSNVTNRGTLIGMNALTFEARQQALNARLAMATPLLELVNEAGGQLLTQGSLTINGVNITNSGSWQGKNIVLAASKLQNNGAITGSDGVSLILSGDLTSAENSKIIAEGSAAIQALNLTNGGQWLAKNLTLRGTNLTNSGEISGVEGLTAALSGAFTQQQGKKLLTDGTLALNAASVSNQGRIEGGDTQITGGTLDNQGHIQGNNNLRLTLTGSLTNRAAGSIISDKALNITTPNLVNYGVLQGETAARIDARDSLRNDGRLLFARDLTLNTAALTNSGWLQATTLLLNAAAVNNSGTAFGENQLTVTANQVNLQATGKLFSGGDLLLNSAGFEQLGQVLALGNLTVSLTNAFTARNTMAAGNRLTLTSRGDITNQSVMQGQGLSIRAGGALINSGQLTAGAAASDLSGSRIAMDAAGSLQSGGDIALTSASDILLSGFTGTSGSLTATATGSIINTALLYAGKNMRLFADSLRNQKGDILAGDNLWMQRDAAGGANSEVVNSSGNIETLRGDISITTLSFLNEMDGLSITHYEQEYPDAVPKVGKRLHGLFYPKIRPDFEISLNEWDGDPRRIISRTERVCTGATNDHCHEYVYFQLYGEDTRQFLLSESIVSVSATGAAARIASGRDITISAENLYNRASHILAGRNVVLTGDVLNNLSAEGGHQNTIIEAKYRCEWFFYSCSGPGLPGVPETDSRIVSSKNSRDYHTWVPYVLGNKFTEYVADGSVYKAVISAGGNVTTNFTSNISNTSTTAHAGGISNSLSAPTLNTLSNQNLGDGIAKQSLSAVDRTVLDAPQWQDRLEDAIRQISGGESLEGDTGSADPIDPENTALSNRKGKTVDISAYPLPGGENGYFVPASDPTSPYLIVSNPKLDGLGQLDPSLFGDLYSMMGMTPGEAPRETDGTYTDRNKFLGSSYFMDRLNLHPEYDYRFLGDAAFDTRYVSNYVLNKTGSRYINGVGSDLAQMQYLMDNAASAQQSLGLQFGIALTAAQIASLDQSLLWWEAKSVNGQTVMVPKVYLSPKDVTVNNGSVIAGNSVQLAGGNISNDGSTIAAKNGLNIDGAGGISNLNSGLISAGSDLRLSSLGDINNIGSRISGKTVELESLDGSINNVTLTDTWRINDGSKNGRVGIADTTVGDIAAITSLDPLSLRAGKDINVTGANVAAGGDLLMNAGGNIAVAANQVTDSYSRSGFRGADATGSSSVTSQGSTITAGGSLGMKAGGDLTVAASAVNAGDNASLTAGNDLNLNAAQTSESSRHGKSESHSTDVARATVSSGGDLTLAAGRDITGQAAGLAAEGDVAMQAGRDVNLLAEETTDGSSYRAKKKVVIDESVRQQGTEIASGGTTTIVAGRDVNSEAAQVTASGDIGVGAGRDINLSTATESDYRFKEETKTKKGFLKKTTTHTVEEDSATREAGTLLSGDNVTLSAGNNLLVEGSSVVGDGDVALGAGNNVDIVAATNTDSTWRLKEKKKSGLMGSGGLGFTIGTNRSRHEVNEDGTTQSRSASTVGSTGGSVSISAGGQAHVGGSDLIAGRDISVTGDSVLIDPGHDRRTRDETFEQKSSGLTIALSGAAGAAVNGAVGAVQAASNESDDRLAALKGVQAGMYGVQAEQALRLDAAQGGDPSNTNAVGISATLGTQSSKSRSHSEQDTAVGSTLTAGNSLSLTATGGDISAAGSQMKAGKDVLLDAARDVNLVSSQNTQLLEGSNKSSGGAVGVGIGVGSGGWGINVSASGNSAHGKENGNGTQQNETTVDAGSQVSIISGRDATLAGAQVSGNNVVADVGRDLTISSQQDSDRYDSRQSSVSGGASFSFGSMSGSASLSVSQDKMHSNYDSVTEQSGIFAGDGGFDITVGKHTRLDGAVIASTADAGNNSLDTGTLGWSSLHNKAEYDVSHSGGSFSTGGNVADQFMGNMAMNTLTNLGSGGDAEGTTRSAVADGSITIRDKASQQQEVSGLSRDTEHANGSISPIFDKEKEQKRLEIAQTIGEIGSQAMDIARTEGKIEATKAAKAKQNDPVAQAAAKEKLEKEGKETTPEAIQKQAYETAYEKAFADTGFGTGGKVQRAMQAATAVIQGLAGGDVAAAIANGAAPYITSAIADSIDDPAARTMAHAAVNAALAAAQGNSALVGAAGAATGEMAAMVALNVYGKPVRELSETEKQTVSALATLAAGLAGGLTGDSTADAVAGAQTGKTVVENNALGDKDAKKLGLRPVKILEVNPLKIGFVDEDGNVNAYGGKAVKPATINKGQQNKHIVGTNEYKTAAASSGSQRSIITVEPQSLLPQLGTGQQVGKIEVGLAGSKERIDFGKVIGTFVDKDTGLSLPTTKGIVHYGKDGAHIVPARP
ncbi:hemagglutinin repeat-containing protein [Dryocola clanedunensis]